MNPYADGWGHRAAVRPPFVAVDGCPECADRLIADANNANTYTFSFDPNEATDSAGFAVTFDVDRARRSASDHLIEWRARRLRLGDFTPPPLSALYPEDARKWLDDCAGINPAHVDHIPTLLDGEPGLLVDFDATCVPDQWRALLTEANGGQIQRITLLLDGNHRLARAVAANRPYPVYVLSPEEARDAFMGATVGAVAVLTHRTARDPITRPPEV